MKYEAKFFKLPNRTIYEKNNKNKYSIKNNKIVTTFNDKLIKLCSSKFNEV